MARSRRSWLLALGALGALWAAAPDPTFTPPVAHEEPLPFPVSRSLSVLLGLGIVILWECFCTIFPSVQPTILTELWSSLCSKTSEAANPRKLIKHKSTVGSLMSEQSKQFSSTPNVASMGWRAEQEKSTLIKAKDFVPKEKGSVIFFANHTVTAQPGPNAVAKIVLLRVGDVSAEVSVELQSMDGTANAGRKYRALSQRVVFQPNVRIASCSVELIEHYAATRSFFVIHTHGIEGNATMGGCSFVRVRLLPTGAWPKGAHEDDVGQLVESDKVMHWRLVFAFSHELFRRRGWKLWHMILAMIWLTFHKVVLNTLLLNYALYDFCLTSTHLATAMGRLPFIALAKLLLVCCDRLADHIKGTSGGAGGATAYLQEVLIHRYLQMADDTVDMGKFLHLLSEVAPDSVAHGYTTVYQLVDCVVSMALSIFMAFIVPMLKGQPPSFQSLQPVMWILVPLYCAFFIGFWLRQQSFKSLAFKKAKVAIEKNETMIDLLECRHWIRTYDSAYPVQHVRKAFDDACVSLGEAGGNFSVFTSDSQWVARYFGELTKVFGILFGGYATLETMKTGEGTMTLGRFTVFLSLYGIIIDAMYTFMKSWDGLMYASMLVSELATFVNEPDRFTPHLDAEGPVDETHPLMTGQFNIKLTSADFYLVNSPTARKTGSVHVPLGQIYGVKTHQDVSILRRRLCEVLGGIRTSNADQVLLGYARHLLLKVPVNLVNGSVLENLLSNVAAWVRVSDVHALLALLGIPIPVPEGEEATHPSTAKMWRVLQEKADIKDDAEVMCHCGWFIERCQEGEFSMTSSADEAQEWLQPSELHLLDIARALLADPEILIIHDMLSIIPLPLARNAVQVLMLWQRLGGLKGLVLAFEEENLPKRPKETKYPDWLTLAGELPRTVFLSESTIVHAGLELDKHLDDWLMIHPGGALDLGGTED
ncbi:Calx-beta domain-containing protein [Durusdinium trenchii]|uniref:Calx-beta domain-containing protein n=1 Tax=Durusdinium trenchii TaxID=1381693 RepID=A0ABP0HE33_9DINO